MANWSYVKKWENPLETIKAIDKEYGRITSSPVFFGYWAKVSLYRVALKDYEEGLHSLIQENTCTCGLRINKSDNPQAIIESKHHRNHKTLEPEPNPKFRGLVGRRISMPLMSMDWRHEVDVLWDAVVKDLSLD
ncbi:MAG: hypothetical protein NTW23_01310 [Rhodoluna sp.]|nr:hypothetical protein [Rhodoluna sp.]